MKKTLLVNLYVIIFLLLTAEFSWRLVLTIKNFDKLNNKYSNYFGRTWHRVNSVNLGQFDKKLIKTLIPNLEIKNVDLPRWEKNSIISSDELGFRKNSHNLNLSKKSRILAVGDSYTFGDQTSDNSTWPACLEKKLNIKTDNGGYGGYSAGQAVRKAVIESKKRKYSHIIWSIFFPDFERDFSKKLIILNDEGNLGFAQQIENKKINLKENKNLIYEYLKEYSFIIYHWNFKVFPNIKRYLNKKKAGNNDKSTIDENFFNIEYSLIDRNIKFLINEYKKINVDKKIILYQYDDNFKNIVGTEKIRKIIKKHLKNSNILVIDTADKFLTLDSSELKLLWFGHHTSYGNKVVCEYIVKKLQENKFILN